MIRLIAPLLPWRDSPSEPIFIIGAPRSGTTLIFELLARSPAVASLTTESHVIWDIFHPVDESGWTSHQLGPELITGRERRALYWAVNSISQGRRYLDKLPRNSLRIPYLRALFPDAWFLFIKRDGRDTVSSLITGWRSGRRFGPASPPPIPLSIAGYKGSTWNFLVPPGWEAYATGKSLEDVCAYQWRACIESVLTSKQLIDPSHWVEVRYEDLIDEPRGTLKGVLEALRLPVEGDVFAMAETMHANVSQTAVGMPRPGKWREENPDEIARVLPSITPWMKRLGYAIDEP
jgi:sulfotransferase family protein